MKRWILIMMVMVIAIGMNAACLYADDTDLFMVKVPPDVLITLDLSGSMNWTPPGSNLYVGSDDGDDSNDNLVSCSIDGPFYGKSGPGHTHPCYNLAQIGGPIYGDSACNGPFYKTSGTGHSTNCSRLAIAKRAIFDILDDTDNGVINSQDETSLAVRFGYMRFYACGNDSGTSYNGGCNQLIKTFNTAYNQINTVVQGEGASGGTALAYSLTEAKLYIEDSKTGDTAAACRKKFVLLITDGEDTLSCGGTGYVNQPGDYKRRRETVAKAKALADAGYNVFVVGFGGNMPHYLKYTLNWAAKFGGTDNPLSPNSGNLAGYNPSLVTSCQDSTELSHNLGEGTHYYADSNDPGEAPLSGYAFLAEDASQLGDALTAILKYIQERSYSFTAPTIPLVRIVDKDVGYVSSFIPDDTPFWRGNLKAYTLNSDGTFPVDSDGNPLNASLIWDAVEQLKTTSASSRRIYTYVNNTLTEFTYSNLTNTDLGFPSDSLYDPERQKIIDHIRGIDAYDINQNLNTTEERNWKLGDIFHSNAVIVGSPNRNFEDVGFSGSGGFYDTNKNRTKMILVGANDGLLHAFNAGTGVEEWAFIPPSILKTLQLMPSAHTYYVDGSPKVSDVWLYSTSTDTTKSADEWRTILICGLRKGGKQYFALDITDTLNPVFLWDFPRGNDAATLAKVGQSWSDPAIGKVKVEQGGELYERWVAFIGGGLDPNETKTVKAGIGRAFFVIDIKTGEIIWEYSSDPSVNYPTTDQRSYMTFSFPSAPTPVDTDGNGYVDKVYIGDLGGQMWAFNVSFNAANKTSNSLWSAYRLTMPPASNAEKHPVFYQPAVAFDDYRNPWVYYGTGDRENPLDTTNPPEFFYAVKDDGIGVYPRRENQELQEISSVNTFTPDLTKKGWYLILDRSAQLVEKVLARPVVFDNILYFTSYAYKGNATGCSIEGDARLYMLYFQTGGGALNVDELSDLKGTPSSSRYTVIGQGVPSNPVISVNNKGVSSIVIGTTNNQVFSDQAFSSGTGKSLLYWREVVR
jgi:type IV pilus assembly protein PilY1